MKSSKKQKCFEVFKWWSNKVGWVRCTFELGTSWEDVVRNNTKYANKHEYLILEVRKEK